MWMRLETFNDYIFVDFWVENAYWMKEACEDAEV